MEDILVIFCIRLNILWHRGEGKQILSPPDVKEEWKDLSGEDLGK